MLGPYTLRHLLASFSCDGCGSLCINRQDMVQRSTDRITVLRSVFLEEIIAATTAATCSDMQRHAATVPAFRFKSKGNIFICASRHIVPQTTRWIRPTGKDRVFCRIIRRNERMKTRAGPASACGASACGASATCRRRS
jgi:hypothetical protein